MLTSDKLLNQKTTNFEVNSKTLKFVKLPCIGQSDLQVRGLYNISGLDCSIRSRWKRIPGPELHQGVSQPAQEGYQMVFWALRFTNHVNNMFLLSPMEAGRKSMVMPQQKRFALMKNLEHRILNNVKLIWIWLLANCPMPRLVYCLRYILSLDVTRMFNGCRG